MTTDNLFEKYGIKEVADVTLYRIEKKKETFESQRKIAYSSILKGALSTATVYPMDSDGKGEEEGFKAYVFKDADVLKHTNYDCDDKYDVNAVFYANTGDTAVPATAKTALENYLNSKGNGSVLFKSIYNKLTEAEMSESELLRAISFAEDVTVSQPETIGEESYVAYATFKNQKDTGLGDEESKEFTFDVLEGSQVVTASETKTVGAGKSITVEITLPTTYKAIVEAIYDAAKAAGLIAGTDKDKWIDIVLVDTDKSLMTTTLAVQKIAKKIVKTYAKVKVNTEITITEDKKIAAKEYLVKEGLFDSKGNIKSLINLLNALAEQQDAPFTALYSEIKGNEKTIIANFESYKYYEFKATISVNTGDLDTGIYSDRQNSLFADPNKIEEGTHEFGYVNQVLMLFAKNQNLIDKKCVRYKFKDLNVFGNLTFDDNFASAPYSTDKVVVCGIAGCFSENLYDFDEINEAIKQLTDTFEAKAYDIVYNDYAELVVNDEMGYFLPAQLGIYDKTLKNMNFFTADNTYVSNAVKGVDLILNNAKYTWGNDTHYSINDAIDALKQKKKTLDSGSESTLDGANAIFGGYKVSDKYIKTHPYNDYAGVYSFLVDNKTMGNSAYNLESVLEALSTITGEDTYGRDIKVADAGEISNRAIYVNVDNSEFAAASAIYLLHNVNSKTLATETDGIFEFHDKKGNKLNYQDIIFAGIEYLALVVIGNKGLIFVVDRHATKKVEKTAWMVNESGYLTDTQAKKVAEHGLIHTIDITQNDETFEATCTVGSIKVKKIKKDAIHYVPVLYLDTLKMTSISQSAETTDATGGHGNAKLITWDYGKDITLEIQDALFTPASMSAIWGSYEGSDFKSGVKDTHRIDRMEKIVAKRSFIVPAGNSLGLPSELDLSAQAVYFDPHTMEPYQDGTPIAEGEVVYKWTRSIAYSDNSIGKTIEISADKFPGTYRVVGETYIRNKTTGEDHRYQFIIPQAKMLSTDQTISLEADGDPVVFDFSLSVQRPDDGVMMKFVQYDVVENEEENDGSTMVKDTENLNLLDSAEVYKVGNTEDDKDIIGATEY